MHCKRTASLADVAEVLRDSKRIGAEHYVNALVDYREVDRRSALERVRRARNYRPSVRPSGVRTPSFAG